MALALDIQAYALRIFFNLLGYVGSFLLNFRVTKGLTIQRNLSYGPDPKHKIDVFRPNRPDASYLPILVYFHGGGWISADKRIYDGICATLARFDYLTFNVNYRLAPGHRFPAQCEDVAQAIDWIHENALRLGGNPSQIVLGGDSAGAQLASWYTSALHQDGLFAALGIATHLPTTDIRGMLLFYGVYDFNTVLETPFPFIKIYATSFLGNDKEEYRRNAALASPMQHLAVDLPPSFLCVGERDGLYQQTVAYTKALVDNAIDCQSVLFDMTYRANHGFLFYRWSKASKLTFAAVGKYLRGLA